MNGRYNKFFRCGGIENNSLEPIYETMQRSLGTAYSTDSTSIVDKLTFVYARETDSLLDEQERYDNRFNPEKCSDSFLSELKGVYGYTNIKLSNDKIRLLLTVHHKYLKSTISQQVINDALTELIPNTFNGLFLVRTTASYPIAGVTGSYAYAPNIDTMEAYIDITTGINYVGDRIKPLHPEIETESNPIINLGGIVYNYSGSITDKWFDSRATLIVKVKNINFADFGSDLNLAREFLNRFLPAHMNFTFTSQIGFIIDDGSGTVGTSLDSYEACLS